MKTKLAGVAVAAVMAFGFGEVRQAEASFINAVGFAPTVIYDNQTLNVTGPISATFYYNQVGEDTYLAAGFDIKFTSNGKQYDVGEGDDGYGSVSLSPGEISIVTTYFAEPVFISASSLEAKPVQGQSFEDGKSYRVDSSSLVESLTTTPVFDEDGIQVGDFIDEEISFHPYAIGINTVAAVPLPASAPMFGAALMALGVAGYSLKRKAAVA